MQSDQVAGQDRLLELRRQGSTFTDAVKQVLMEGHEVNEQEAASLLGCHISLIGNARRKLDLDGWQLTTRSEGSKTYWRTTGRGDPPKKKERSAGNPNSKAGEIRRRLLAGEEVSAILVAAELGCATSRLRQVMIQMQKRGNYRFTKQIRDGHAYWRILKRTNRPPPPAKKETVPDKKLPALGETVVIHLLHLDMDGNAFIGIRDSIGNSWMTEVKGRAQQ